MLLGKSKRANEVRLVEVKATKSSRNVMVTLKRNKCVVTVPMNIKYSTEVIHYSAPSIVLPFLLLFIILTLAVLAYVNAVVMLSLFGVVLIGIAYIVYRVAKRLEAYVETKCPEDKIASLVIRYVEKCNSGESLYYEFPFNGWKVKAKCPGFLKCKGMRLTNQDKLMLTGAVTAVIGAVCMKITPCVEAGYALLLFAIAMIILAGRIKPRCPNGFDVRVNPIRVEKAWISYYTVIPGRALDTSRETGD